ncbi:hypothetical protein ORI89_01120 [Sphingobacterium sp. UT-1RO-CII-1]|nr:hypothetical protein [Sphingobacterium sp. UT-1RO-CII-1]
MSKIISFLIKTVCFTLFSLIVFAQEKKEIQNCEQIMRIALDKITPLIDKNDFNDLESVLMTIQSTCGDTEFTQRLRILRALIEKKTTGDLIADYFSKKYVEVLIMRWDYSIEEEYKSIYQDNKSYFNYVPLRHPVDSLIKLKANALLYSTSYNLTEQEQEIILLFSDQIEEFQQTYTPSQENSQSQNNEKNNQFYKDKYGLQIYAGVEYPLTGTNPVFKTSPTFGVTFASKLSSDLLYEIGAKVRINNNAKTFDYQLYDDIETINSSASYSFGGNIGYKLLDNDTFILSPKIGLYWESTSTGLSEIIEDYYDDYGNSVPNIRFNNVNTMRTSIALSLMRYLMKKQYIGIELAYHFVPYNWEKNLITSIQPHYSSAQLFYRF